jgi:UDP-N-acetyl-D-glucosamine dehydrogenase
MPDYVVERAAEALDRASGKGLRRSEILLIGMAYKANVEDMRGSPALEIMERFEARGANVAYFDPWVPVIPKTREHGRLASRRSIELSAETTARFDLVVVVTDHRDVDYRLIADHAKLIVDTRNAFGRIGIAREHINKA